MRRTRVMPRTATDPRVGALDPLRGARPPRSSQRRGIYAPVAVQTWIRVSHE